MNDDLHIMVDIETLGTRPDAAILSIGAVVFAPFAESLICDRFYRGIDLASAMAGRAVDASTVRFWIVRPGNAFDAAFNGTDELAPSLAAADETPEATAADEDWEWGGAPAASADDGDAETPAAIEGELPAGDDLEDIPEPLRRDENNHAPFMDAADGASAAARDMQAE